ncbi:putative F-box protein At1g23770 [Tasmannia lanceolata]|uniref:putative F-box protein At1g23770 n=1 Tax=Tasmannia lanceolata TaxID=3420 RepID=UPI004063C8E8
MGSSSCSSVSCFMRRVFKEIAINEKGKDDLRVLMIAVHAIFLDSGFMALNPSTDRVSHGFHIPEKGSKSPVLSIRYTLPDLLNSDADFVVLKFQILGKSLIVYGSLMGFENHRLSLDASRFVPSLDFVCRNGDGNCELKDALELWKIVKDGLCLPLLIGLCEDNRLSLPPCFMGLPIDLKTKILGLLPSIDIGKMASVCSELKYLTSSDDLWKYKFLEEFGQLDEKLQGSCWKEKFALKNAEKKKMRRVEREFSYSYLMRRLPMVEFDPFPGGFTLILDAI